jgi:hypothetical protein
VEADWSAGNWQRATSSLEALRRQSPAEARYTDPLYAAYIFWGDDSLANGDRKGAASHYNQAIALDPSRGEARDALTALTPIPTARPTQPPTATVLRPAATATPIPLPPSSGSGSNGGGSGGCGSRGGPGYRLPNGKCAGWR